MNAPLPVKQSLVAKFASKYYIEPETLLNVLKATAFKVKDGNISNEQMAALLVVADQHDLNPFTKEIYAYPDKGGIVPVVSVDGWLTIINRHPQFDGLEFRESEDIVTMPGARPCPAWMDVIIHRKDRSHPIIIREYLGEVYRPPFRSQSGGTLAGPWQTHPARFLRHKTLIQGARVAFRFAGLSDDDEAQRILESQGRMDQAASSHIGQSIEVKPERGKASRTRALVEQTERVDESEPSSTTETGAESEPNRVTETKA